MARLHPIHLAAAIGLALQAGCAGRVPLDPAAPATSLRQRTGSDARLDGVVTPTLPAGVRPDDGVSADEAVAMALWNNAAFQSSVSDLGFARADLQEAGMFTNPVLSLLFPVGPKQLEATLRWPIEVLWERPRRVAAARLALDAAGQRLVQTGLDLVMAVRIAYADASLAADRAPLIREAGSVLARIDTLTQSRLTEGDISELEARTVRIEAARATLDAERAVTDALVARQRLLLLIGQPDDLPALALTAPAELGGACGAPADLLREARMARPDVRAAELGVEAAAARLGWERSRILALTAVLDANGQGREGFEMGPGLDLGVPVFNRNQGGRTRAKALLQQATTTYAALQQQVGLDVREGVALLDQAQAALSAWRATIVRPLGANVADAERSFREGETSMLFVLENTRRLIEARVRERELVAEQQRSRARIERAVGRSCQAPTQEAARDR